MNHDRRSLGINLAVSALLALATAAVYWPVAGHAFINYDDSPEIYDNPHITGGLAAGNVAWALTATENANWLPLTRLSYMTDWELFGEWAGGHHLVSVGLHTATGIILMLVLARMTGRLAPSAAVAALFLLHPLHVESVAWAVERKDTLSGLAWMLTLAAYAWYVRRPGVGRYALVFVSLALGLMAKPMLVTLPLVLLLVDWWPLGRLRGGPAPSAPMGASAGGRPGGDRSAGQPPGKRGAAARAAASPGTDHPEGLTPGRTPLPALRLVLEKAPLLALVAASSIVTFIVQSSGGAVAGVGHLPFGERLANSLVAYVAYLGKTIVPMNLAIFYPYDRHLPVAEAVGAGGILAAATALAALLWRRRPYAAVGWFWYVGTLVPVIGLVQVGSQSMADRYTYLPLIGIFIAAAWGAADVAARWRLPRRALAAAGAIVAGACMIVSFLQVRHWADSETVFRRALAVTSDNWLAQNNLAKALTDRGETGEAVRHYPEAIRANPGFADAHYNLGLALTMEGRAGEAIAHLQDAIRIKPDYADAHCTLGNALAARGRTDEAIKEYQEALRLDPNHAKAHNNMGLVLARQGKMEDAIDHFRQAVKSNPRLADAHSNLGSALVSQGKTDEATGEYREAIRIKPDYLDARFNLGVVLAGQGQTQEAIRQYREVLRLDPNYGPAREGLTEALAAPVPRN